MFKIKMTRQSDNQSLVMIRMNPQTLHDANQIVETLNRVNVEAAKMTGQAVRFVFEVIGK